MNSRIDNRESEIERDMRETIPARDLEHRGSRPRVHEPIALHLHRSGQDGQALSTLDLECNAQTLQLTREASGIA